jgi:hypothetical protein
MLKGGDHALTATDYHDENEQMSGKKRTTRQSIVCGTDFSATASEAVDNRLSAGEFADGDSHFLA